MSVVNTGLVLIIDVERHIHYFMRLGLDTANDNNQPERNVENA